MRDVEATNTGGGGLQSWRLIPGIMTKIKSEIRSIIELFYDIYATRYWRLCWRDV